MKAKIYTTHQILIEVHMNPIPQFNLLCKSPDLKANKKISRYKHVIIIIPFQLSILLELISMKVHLCHLNGTLLILLRFQSTDYCQSATKYDNS